MLPELVPGQVFSVPVHRTTNSRAGWCVRLFGRSLTDGMPVFGFSQGDYTELVYLSASFIKDRCSRVSWDEIPPDAAEALSDCLSNPPVVDREPGRRELCRRTKHWTRVQHLSTPRPMGQAGGVSPQSLRELLSPYAAACPAAGLSFADIMSGITWGPCRSLLASDREARLLLVWGLPAQPTPSVIIFGRLESAVCAWAKRHGVAGERAEAWRPPVELLERYVRQDSCSTIATGRSNHPLVLDVDLPEGMGFLPTSALCVAFGMPLDDALAVALMSAKPGRAQQALCQGVSLCSVRPILEMLRSHPSSPLRGVATWDVSTAFSGADVFCAGLRTLQPPQPYRLVGASEPKSYCRRLVSEVHPDLADAAFPHDATSAEAVSGVPCHLAFWGFPCVRYSGLARGVTAEDLAETLSVLDAALAYIRSRRPRVFLLENVPALLGRHRAVLDKIMVMLSQLGYGWFWDVLCPTDFGEGMARPRLFLLGWVRGTAGL